MRRACKVLASFSCNQDGGLSELTYTREKPSGTKACQNSTQDQTNGSRGSTANETAEFKDGERRKKHPLCREDFVELAVGELECARRKLLDVSFDRFTFLGCSESTR